MKKEYRLWVLSLLLVITLPVYVAAQTQNVGYYEKVGEDGDTTIYQLVSSVHVPSAEDEPMLPGDETVVWDGRGFGGCEKMHPDAQLYLDTLNSQAQEAPGSGVSSTSDDNDVPDCMQVNGKKNEQYVVVILTGKAKEDASGSKGIFRGIARPPPD